MNKIAKSEIVKAIAQEPNAGGKACTKSGDDECICFDGIAWESAAWDGKSLSNDPVKYQDYLLKIESIESDQKKESDALKLLVEEKIQEMDAAGTAPAITK